MEYIPCTKRLFPFKIDLITYYALYLRSLRHLCDRLGYQNIIPLWKNIFSQYDNQFLMAVLSSRWQEVESGDTNKFETKVEELITEFFPSPGSGLSAVEARKIIDDTPPIRQVRQLFPNQMMIEKEIIAYDALHIRFDGLACLAEALIGKYGKQGELIAYDLMTESRLAASQGETGSVEEFIEGFTSSSDTPSLFSAGLEMEVISKSAREAVVHVKECEWARYFQDRHPQVGYLMACSTDEVAYKAFNPNLRMQRTGTIMEGCDRCDFRIFTAAENLDQ